MTTQKIVHADAENLSELTDAVAAMRDFASAHDMTTVYLKARDGDGIRLTLEEETLSDGSKVMNVYVSVLQ